MENATRFREGGVEMNVQMLAGGVQRGETCAINCGGGRGERTGRESPAIEGNPMAFRWERHRPARRERLGEQRVWVAAQDSRSGRR